jgi:LPXTG-motif cell wall-anchored protein
MARARTAAGSLPPLPEIPDPTIPDDFIPLPELPDPTVPDDLAPIPPDDDPDPDPTDPPLPDSRCEATGGPCPTDPQDPTPGTPQGSLPQTGASAMVIAGLALAATTAGAFLCLAAGRRSRTHG